MNRKKIVFFAFCLTILFGGLQSHAAEDRCVKVLTVSDRLKSEVLRLEAELKRELSETEKAAANVTEVNTQITELEQTMSWTEKNLWKWLARLFGGDAAKIDQLKSRNAKKAELVDLLKKDEKEDADADQAILAKIDAWLQEHDSNFAKLREVESQLNNMVCKGNTCLSKIDDAISAAQSAQNMEMLDMVSDNNGISLLSSMNTSSANDAANTAQRAAKKYIEAVNALKVKLDAQAVEVRNVDDTVDLVMDLVFDFGFDFMSAVNMFALSDLKSDLGQLRGQIAQIRDGFNSEYEEVKSDLEKTLCAVRNTCNEISSEPLP